MTKSLISDLIYLSFREVLLFMSFRGALATRNLKDPSLCSGHGFLPAVEMTGKSQNDGKKVLYKDLVMIKSDVL